MLFKIKKSENSEPFHFSLEKEAWPWNTSLSCLWADAASGGERLHHAAPRGYPFCGSLVDVLPAALWWLYTLRFPANHIMVSGSADSEGGTPPLPTHMLLCMRFIKISRCLPDLRAPLTWPAASLLFPSRLSARDQERREVASHVSSENQVYSCILFFFQKQTPGHFTLLSREDSANWI